MTIERQKTEKRNRIIFLDGIRGWASAIVLFSHLYVFMVATFQNTPRFDRERLIGDISSHYYLDIVIGVLFRFFTDGSLAVQIFFVLSGFALSASLIGKKIDRLRTLIATRYFRLMLPILITSMLTFALIKSDLLFNTKPKTIPGYAEEWLESFFHFPATMTSVLRFSLFDVFFNYDPRTSYNSSLWTMPVEFAGSVIIYFFLAIFEGSEFKKYYGIGAAALALILYPPLACFFSGYVLAEQSLRTRAIDPRKSAQTGFYASLFLILVFLSTYYRNNSYLSWLFATLIVFSIDRSTGLTNFFKTRISQYLGRVSFSLYLLQIAVICSWTSWLSVRISGNGEMSSYSCWTIVLSTVSLTFFAATVFSPLERKSAEFAKVIVARLFG